MFYSGTLNDRGSFADLRPLFKAAQGALGGALVRLGAAVDLDSWAPTASETRSEVYRLDDPLQVSTPAFLTFTYRYVFSSATSGGAGFGVTVGTGFDAALGVMTGVIGPQLWSVALAGSVASAPVAITSQPHGFALLIGSTYRRGLLVTRARDPLSGQPVPEVVAIVSRNSSYNGSGSDTPASTCALYDPQLRLETRVSGNYTALTLGVSLAPDGAQFVTTGVGARVAGRLYALTGQDALVASLSPDAAPNGAAMNVSQFGVARSYFVPDVGADGNARLLGFSDTQQRLGLRT